MNETLHEKSWYLAQLKPNGAARATRNLTRQGFETFYPLEDVTRRVSGKFIQKPRPLFPGYLFVALDIQSGPWRSVNSTQGVSRLVSFGREPSPVPGGLIDSLRRRCDENGLLKQLDEFQPGETVSVTWGPFADFVGQVEKIAPDKRVFVLMEMMGAKTRVILDPTHLRSTGT